MKKKFLYIGTLLTLLVTSSCDLNVNKHSSIFNGSNSSLTTSTNSEKSIEIVLPDYVTLPFGSTLYFEVKAQNIDEIYFSSSNENVAYVDEHGNLQTIGGGTTVITAYNGDISDSVTIEVIAESIASLTIKASTNEIYINESTTISPEILPSNYQQYQNEITYNILRGTAELNIENGQAIITPKTLENIEIQAYLPRFNLYSNIILIKVKEKQPLIDITLSCEKETVEVNEPFSFNIEIDGDIYQDMSLSGNAEIKITAGSNYVTYNQNNDYYYFIVGNVEATFQAQMMYEGTYYYSNEVTITSKNSVSTDKAFIFDIERDWLVVGDVVSLKYQALNGDINKVEYRAENNQTSVAISNSKLTALKAGTVTIKAYNGNVESQNEITLTIYNRDPYSNVDEDEFYDNYQEATSYGDSYYRSKNYLMSGDISLQDQEPTIVNSQPSENGLLIKNIGTKYDLFNNSYEIVDKNGNYVKTIYKDGGYVTLDDVAAYVYAYGDIPSNYTESKSSSPYYSPWGEYLRLNNSYFSGDTDRYPYEPVLPRISGEGGDLEYYEIDIGTTGTDCDPKYESKIYNDGYEITRGAARIVYSRYKNGKTITDLENDRYVFYTYNHYNDFQEYLNYYQGYGEIFGNITGGGTISKYNSKYPPTEYEKVIKKNLLS